MGNDLVSLYDEEYVTKFEADQSPERLRRLLPLMDLGAKNIVADFACGNGMLMELVAPMVQEYVGVDFSQRFIEAANRKRDRLAIRNASFVCARIEDFCTQYPEHFDTCLVMDASEHIPDGEWISILTGIRFSMKSKGKLYVHTPNADFFLEIMKSKNFLVKQFREHVAVRTASRNAELLYEAGFSEVETSLLPHYNFLKYLHPLSFFPGVGKYFKARIFLSAEK
jgi:2-polyprenyl-3-methyl-5-hydroxy-6-metoxy-1,4-benzoquinol methylase